MSSLRIIFAILICIVCNNICYSMADDSNCKTKITKFQPFQAQDRTWHNPLQREYLNQEIEQIECVDEGAPCFNDAKFSTGLRVKTFCKTEVIKVQIHLFSLIKNETLPDFKEIKVGCGCHFKSDE